MKTFFISITSIFSDFLLQIRLIINVKRSYHSINKHDDITKARYWFRATKNIFGKNHHHNTLYGWLNDPTRSLPADKIWENKRIDGARTLGWSGTSNSTCYQLNEVSHAPLVSLLWGCKKRIINKWRGLVLLDSARAGRFELSQRKCAKIVLCFA